MTERKPAVIKLRPGRLFSPPQADIINLILGGISKNEDIARSLNKSPHTVRNELSDIFDIVESYLKERPANKAHLILLISSLLEEE